MDKNIFIVYYMHSVLKEVFFSSPVVHVSITKVRSDKIW
jgi:hypothetical protein